jgi:hypothetical protein
LDRPPRFTPWTKGVFGISPSLKPLGTPFGNGQRDKNWFILDDRRDEFIDSKTRAVEEDREKYVRRSDMSGEVEAAAAAAISARLGTEYPSLSDRAAIADLDELAMLVQEDICVVRADEDRDWFAYAHLCSPSHWRASDKVGQPFFDVHSSIPGIEKVNRAAAGLVDAMIHRGPFIRFAWTVESDTRPNHHPDPPPGEDPLAWHGRDFSAGRFWVRVERQVIWGLPAVEAAIFTIKICHMPDYEIVADPILHQTLRSTLLSMSEETRRYKGLARDWDRLMNLLPLSA